MIKASFSDKELVTDILYSAFVNIKKDNSISFVVKQDSKRNKRLRFLMEYLFLTSFEFGEVFISDNKKACLLINYPHLQKTTLKNSYWKLLLIIKTIGIFNVFKILKRERELNKNHIKTPHIHPIITGVLNEHQQKGIGVRLIKEVLLHFKNNQLPCIIETTTKENLKLYKKFGFKIVRETHSLNYPLFFLRKDF
ncbi:GNAT family N-acetyltransferase [Tenacibaculum aiptasiae]|uniref:GNAT family N-acetyltransferase n=1 Tax=Tenacibaculum aiptasiae TaxID=426481 RepID=A0A7J5AMC3_9FLAO|nr:GNAT family N-acetyltransferase [Tenacibaculum aiptasiae]KAB1158706.1 GNAT family N-acetyltransferase [Tenacibaculum aiptasiae]